MSYFPFPLSSLRTVPDSTLSVFWSQAKKEKAILVTKTTRPTPRSAEVKEECGTVITAIRRHRVSSGHISHTHTHTRTYNQTVTYLVSQPVKIWEKINSWTERDTHFRRAQGNHLIYSNPNLAWLDIASFYSTLHGMAWWETAYILYFRPSCFCFFEEEDRIMSGQARGRSMIWSTVAL